MKIDYKRLLPDAIVVILFAVVAFAYFFPADMDGRILYRHDSSAGVGAGAEISAYTQTHDGEVPRWTNSIFSGMPTYQMAPSYDSLKPLSFIEKVYHLWLPENVWFVFAYLLGFYILLRAFDFKQWMAALGAVVWAFSSYFFIIIAAGHLWKVMALAYLPPLIGGIILAWRRKYIVAFVVTALFSGLEIIANHIQMTYYYLFIILFMFIGFFIESLRKKELAHFAKMTGVCLAGAIIGVCMNLSNLYHTWQYSQESMRGKSELVKKNSADQTNSGLERSYITQWSYGIDETWTLLIPNTKGGASMPLSQSKIAMNKANPDFESVYVQMGQYWGNQPMTSGPVYVGAFVCFLFILGLFIVKGSLKWSLLAATILSILLSWGHNFMPMTDFFIDNVPMYAKFRTVASILVIAEFTIPLLAMLALKRIVEEPEIFSTKFGRNAAIGSFAFTGGICLLFAIAPGTFFPDFISIAELKALSGIPAEYLVPLTQNLTEMRQAVFVSDCWRSFIIIAIGCAALFAYVKGKLNTKYMVGVLIILCLVDMWQVNKRYLNDDMFVEKSLRDTPKEPSETDKIILQDKALDYRVLNLSTSTFNENETSFFHKSIGGYHAAKLRRYQELIEAHISPETQKAFSAVASAGGDMSQVDGNKVYPVLNMLNTKYFILPLQGGQTAPVLNPYAYGNAWMVDKVTYVDNANDELSMTGKLPLRHEAVADKKFESVLGASVTQDGVSEVNLLTYAPDELSYEVKTDKGGVVVFSEVYYPGWTATVDGTPAELGRVNYVLRALKVGPGTHKVELAFHPTSITTTETIAYIALVLLLLSVVAVIVREIKKK